jgi:hypothetical protein
MPFNDTPNNGGEYKMWFWPIGSGTNYKTATGTKTDNFKVRAPSTCSISGMKWREMSNFGVMDIDEEGVPEWEIFISGANLPLGYPTTTTTAADGSYAFVNLPNGTYTVCEVQQEGWEQTFPTTNEGCWEVTVNNADVTGRNFGNVKLVSISGMKWGDLDKSSTKNGEEVGLAGWTITISGPVPSGYVTTATTSDDPLGYYEFANLRPGTYTICEVQQNEFEQTYPDPTVNGGCHEVILGAENETGVNFGNSEKTYKISGSKFYDSMGLGQVANFLPGGLAGWTITLSKNGSQVDSDTTVIGGGYEFEVVAGTYKVCETPQAGYLQSYPADDPENGRCHVVTVNYQMGDSEGNDFANYIKIAGTKRYETTGGQGVGNIKILVGLCEEVTCTLPTPAAADLIPVCTAEDGSWSLILPKAAVAVMVQEELPADWEKVSPTSLGYTILVGAANQMELDFVNICYKIIRNTGDYTLGFWSNRNGELIIVNQSYLTLVIAPLNLRDAAGNDVNFGTYAAFRTWLLGGTATNMAYMLSVQMAATALSVANTPALGGFEVTDPNGETKTVAELIVEASALLGGCEGLSPCLVTQSGELRTLMEKYKNIFDKLNNNSYEVRVKSETPCDNRSTGCPLPPTP